ncbi:transcription-repair coupling factor [Thermodesulfovibrio aggregans]|uniref:Transcription-repair-coupling factor n=1 Tax=Thermodesulfovibrio aggregans TaxID=86166 RepID=A0A0U9HQZ6_9BACT|nr:transcription-repair coupling factor [Thermodesulfovibrio aggregans]GAQ94138.1 transcription-repair coupling factor [Thermodesulfovibrio aggregans]
MNHAESIHETLLKEVEKISNLIQTNEEIYNLSITSFALFLCFAENYIVFEENEQQAYKLYSSIKSLSEFFNRPNDTVLLPSEGNDRLVAVFKILHENSKKIITTLESGKIPTQIENIHIKKSITIERELLRNRLLSLGYTQVELVTQEGEFSEHGWVFDVWGIGEEYPVRVEFFGDEIEEIKIFNPETQLSVREKNEIWIIPAKENDAKTELTDLFEFDNVFIVGSRFFETNPGKKVTKISHLPIQFSSQAVDGRDKTFYGLGILPNERKNLSDFPKNLKALGIPIIFSLSSRGKAETIKEILFSHGIIAPLIHKNEVGNYSGKYATTISELQEGLFRESLMIITDFELFAEKPIKKKKSAISKIPLDGLEINEGDFVVHKEHGIGIFRGIKRQKYEDTEEDVLVVEYKEGDILYVPTWNIEKIYRYSARDGFVPPLDKLGSNRWQKAKERERKKIQDIADKLLNLYAQRKTPRGFIYSEDTEIHKNFDEFFPYEETEDQQNAIDAILKKMRQPLPMEVLLCGDAGYGKTEVAMRAAFRAVYDGKQVAVLVPTTLLCEQHYRTFKKRFEAFPVKIEYLSRFRSAKEIKKVIEDVKTGKVDILIGTHMIVLKEVEFFDLGLLIIDEEQKFGVIHKEKIKEKYPKVDLLTITATPIPRTLQIGLSGLWDIFVIQTPPKERLAVRTFVIHENDSIIKEAIEKEIQRAGQVYFLHNRIHDIELVKSKLQSLVPSARIAVAHGRMKEKVLDRVMLDFLDGKIDVLLCTSIIAAGLDIPNVNTIIIDQAHTFGLSDLYQIRGRVGRSSIQANAYLIIPSEDSLSENAKKRIKAIQEMSYLGAGFHIALKDLEIRGAGELLGVEQSGINRLGFDLYIEMLNEAVKEAKGEALSSLKLPEIKFSLPAFIPEEYIKETSMRIRIYRKLSQISQEEELQKLKDEIYDRFGNFPQEVENLFKTARIRILASKIKISQIRQTKDKFRFTVEENLEPAFVTKLLNTLTGFKNKGIVRDLKFYQNGFEVSIKRLDELTSFLSRLIYKLDEKK